MSIASSNTTLTQAAQQAAAANLAAARFVGQLA